jgi:3-dehydroquinate dehydratase type I
VERNEPDLFEIRFDMMEGVTPIAKIRQVTDLPLIATNRRRSEGGFFRGTEEARIETLANATQDGFDYVDIELNTRNLGRLVRSFKQEGARVIVSCHNAKNTPEPLALESTLRRERDADADVCKIVTTARSYADNLRCLTFLNKHARKTKLVCFAMGGMGMLSRALSPIFGAYFTFASSGVRKQTAAGQIPVSSLRNLYDGLEIA